MGKKGQKPTLGFKPAAVTKRLLAVLTARGRDVLVKRYGLGERPERMTLEAIGQIYGITRERVRQIENYSMSTIGKSEQYEKEQQAFDDLEELIHSLGVIVPEDEFLSTVSKDESTRNHIHFLLVVGSPFVRCKEDEHFTHRWHVNADMAHKVEDALERLYESLSDDELIPEGELIRAFLEHLKDVSEHYRDEEILRRWLGLTKKIDRNPLGEWGRVSSQNVRLRGVRDYAYLVIREHGSPMHFSEVARKIEELFNRRAHVATTHNELIKDSRFILVGRGLYALSEWGYIKGVVKDVIRAVLKKYGPLSRDEIIEKVLKERYIKENTIVVNLQDAETFKRTSDGKYALV